MSLVTGGEYAGYYGVEVDADPNTTFKFRDADRNDWDNEIISPSAHGHEYKPGWYALDDNTFPNYANTLTFDYSDTSEYQWLACYGSSTPTTPDIEILRDQHDMPVLYINTKDAAPVISKEEYLSATCYLDSRGVEGVTDIARVEIPDTLQIKGRGNWTWTGFDKKPYRLKLAKKTDMLGLEKSKHFGLLAHSDDWSGWMKNTLGFTLSEQVGLAWTPRHQPVELVLNREYRGLYMLTELVRVDKKRVNIVEQPDLCTQPDSIQGGWLIEIDNYGDSEPYHVGVSAPDGDVFYVSAKTPEIWSEAQRDYLQAQMDALTAAVYGDDDEALAAILDIESAARYYLVQELMMDGEAYTGSCFLHKDMDENQWHFGPVWDFGNAYNCALFRNITDDFQPNHAEFRQHLIGALMQRPAMQAAVQNVWNHWRYYDYEAAVAAVEAMSSRIVQASERDWLVPDVQSDAQSQSWTKHQDAAAGKDKLLGYFQAHVTWLTEQWGEGMADVVTEVQNDANRTTARKVLRDGQIVIVRDGVEYNLLGY